MTKRLAVLVFALLAFFQAPAMPRPVNYMDWAQGYTLRTTVFYPSHYLMGGTYAAWPTKPISVTGVPQWYLKSDSSIMVAYASMVIVGQHSVVFVAELNTSVPSAATIYTAVVRTDGKVLCNHVEHPTWSNVHRVEGECFDV